MAGILSKTNVRKTYNYMKRNGAAGMIGAVMERIQSPYYTDYTYEPLSEAVLLRQKEREWKQPVTFSIVVPAYETRPGFFHRLVQSLLEQTYPYWELVIADASSTDVVKQQCESYQDDRIRHYRLKKNGGISVNTNQGIALAKGDYIGLLDHDDFLTPDALYEMARAVEQGKKDKKDYALLYSDEDKCNEAGEQFYEPHFKLDFNLDLFFTNNYICHFLVMKRELMQELGFRPEYDGAQDYDLCLRAVDRLWRETPKVESRICHISRVLYHWRCHEESTAANPTSKSYAYEAGKRALEDFAVKRGWKVQVKELPHVGFYRMEYENGIFSQRPDIAAVGGKEQKKGRICGSIYDSAGRPLYEGIPVIYSGYLHRAVLTQNAARLDIEKWQLNPEVKGKVAAFRKEQEAKGCKNKAEWQKAVCHFLKKEGYRLYWDPQIRV